MLYYIGRVILPRSFRPLYPFRFVQFKVSKNYCCIHFLLEKSNNAPCLLTTKEKKEGKKADHEKKEGGRKKQNMECISLPFKRKQRTKSKLSPRMTLQFCFWQNNRQGQKRSEQKHGWVPQAAFLPFPFFCSVYMCSSMYI